MWSLWCDDPSGKNLARWYGGGTTARGRIGDSGIVTDLHPLTGNWDTLIVKIEPALNTSEFFFNGASIGTLDHSSTGAGDSLGRLRFETVANTGAAGHYLYFDDLRVGEPLTPGDFDHDEDVDQADFGIFQRCVSGDGQAPVEGCDLEDLDRDGDVDQDDFVVFQGCVGGANSPPGC